MAYTSPAVYVSLLVGDLPRCPVLQVSLGLVQRSLAAQGSSLAAQIAQFSPLGRICSLKGLVTAMPMEALCAGLQRTHSCGQGQGPRQGAEQAAADTADAPGHVSSSTMGGVSTPWHWLVDGALSMACRCMQDAPDSHFKFHAASVLNFCMQQVLTTWSRIGSVQQQQRDGQDKAHSPTHSQATCLLPAVVGLGARDRLLQVLWANIDEPMAQTGKQVQEAFHGLLCVLEAQTAAGAAPSAQAWLCEVADSLLGMSYTRKGRYVPLSVLVGHTGAMLLLERCPDLMQQVLLAMQVGGGGERR